MGKIYEALYGRDDSGKPALRDESINMVPVKDDVWMPETPYTVDSMFWPLDDTFKPIKNWGRQLRKSAVAISSLLQDEDTDSYSVMLTGFTDRCGTSLVARNLASTMSFMEVNKRVLVLDFKPTSSPSPDSLMSRLSYLGADRLLSSDFPPGVYVVDVGLSFQESRGMGLPPGLLAFMQLAKKHFDRVVLDAPTFGKNPICDALGRAVDGVALVVPCSRARLPALKAVQTDMEHLGINLLGVVLNQRQYPLPKWLMRFI